MTALEKYLIQLITAQGPISVATFMAEALANEKYGYYITKNPFGRQGDFTTAPEISQIFGEIIGLWHAGNWLNMNRPKAVHLIELGPGRGTLMQDALRAMRVVPGLPKAVKVHLVEISATLRKIQQKKLHDYPAITWHSRIGDALEQSRGEPILVIANEFFDALPIRQYHRTDSGWHERLVGIDEAGKLALRLAPAAVPETVIPAEFHRSAPGSIVEICSIGEHILEQISDHIARFGGAALILDYGYVHRGSGDSLQAVKNHKYVNILDEPGDVDLTTHVNFPRLKEIAVKSNVRVYGPTDQGKFLDALGIRARAEALCATASDTQKADILSASRRLSAADQMGALFKVMAVIEPGSGALAGFEP